MGWNYGSVYDTDVGSAINFEFTIDNAAVLTRKLRSRMKPGARPNFRCVILKVNILARVDHSAKNSGVLWGSSYLSAVGNPSGGSLDIKRNGEIVGAITG